MKYSDLLENFKTHKNKTIKFYTTMDLCDETYAEEGMVGKLAGIREDDHNPKEILVVKVDWSGFEAINEEFESKDWFVNPSANPPSIGTMKEAGAYPEDGIEEYHVMRDEVLHFDFLENFTRVEKAQKAYGEIGSDSSFIEWLAEKAGF